LKTFKSASNTKTGDGLIDKHGFFDCVNNLGMSKYVQEQLFRVFDLNMDGYLDFREYCIGVCVFLSGKYDERVKCR